VAYDSELAAQLQRKDNIRGAVMGLFSNLKTTTDCSFFYYKKTDTLL